MDELDEEEEDGIDVMKDVGRVVASRKRPPGKNKSEGLFCLIKWDIVFVFVFVLSF